MSKLGRNKAIEILMKSFGYGDFYDCNIQDPKTELDFVNIYDYENYDYDSLVDKVANLEVPKDIIMDFLRGEIRFANMDGKLAEDELDYLFIDTNGKIACFTEVVGNVYYLEDFNKKWRKYD